MVSKCLGGELCCSCFCISAYGILGGWKMWFVELMIRLWRAYPGGSSAESCLGPNIILLCMWKGGDSQGNLATKHEPDDALDVLGSIVFGCIWGRFVQDVSPDGIWRWIHRHIPLITSSFLVVCWYFSDCGVANSWYNCVSLWWWMPCVHNVVWIWWVWHIDDGIRDDV